ncbi:MAG: aldehyde dehydrogenase [Bacteroidetes bacterium 43-16]|nr:MAG: aldehyde dehydrogenase [Bacteroidetes bacterium 43-16]
MTYKDLFSAQQAYFRSQQTKDLDFRKANLLKLKKLLIEKEQAMNEAIEKDFGKSAFETYITELSAVLQEIDYYVKNMRTLARPGKVWTNLLNLPGKSRIYTEPLGVVLVIGAWNYPYQLSLCPMVAAMAAGNCCILKPSELPAHTMQVMTQLINTNFDPAYIHVVPGGVEETTALLECPFDKIFFTGSTKVGRIVYEAAAKHLCPVTLELGGKSPAIVTADANLEVAARRITWGKFLNAGQTCVAPDYVLVEEKVKQAFIEQMKAQVQKNDYHAGASHYTQIINERNFNRLLSLMDRDKVILGGDSDKSKRFIAPTLLTGVSTGDAIMQEEIFGPLLPILSFSDYRQALEQVADGEKPLSAYLFSNNQKEQQLFLDHISFGGGCINDVIVHLTNNRMPFGGVGHSGMGSYHGKFGFDTFSHKKSVLNKATWGEPDLKFPPYTASKIKWVRKFL